MKEIKEFPWELVETNPESGSSFSVQRTHLYISCGPEQEPQNGEKNNETRWICINLYQLSNIGHLPDIRRRLHHA
jgi:hypothetical protein